MVGRYSLSRGRLRARFNWAGNGGVVVDGRRRAVLCEA
jgi:hypothetical protein